MLGLLMVWGRSDFYKFGKREIYLLTAPAVEEYQVVQVIDGDTVRVDTGEKIRFLGIDTPELHSQDKTERCLAWWAKQKTAELIGGRRVYVYKDVKDIDKYGRLLRFIFLRKTDTNDLKKSVNYRLVRDGYARVLTIPPDVRHASLFLEAQVKARQEKLGLWSMQECQVDRMKI